MSCDIKKANNQEFAKVLVSDEKFASFPLPNTRTIRYIYGYLANVHVPEILGSFQKVTCLRTFF